MGALPETVCAASRSRLDERVRAAGAALLGAIPVPIVDLIVAARDARKDRPAVVRSPEIDRVALQRAVEGPADDPARRVDGPVDDPARRVDEAVHPVGGPVGPAEARHLAVPVDVLKDAQAIRTRHGERTSDRRVRESSSRRNVESRIRDAIASKSGKSR